MARKIKLDQVGLSAGVTGRARTDGLLTAAKVTLTNTGTGTTRFQFLHVPVGDTGSVSSLASVSPSVWEYTPTASKPGTYRIELIEDEGLPSEYREVVTFRMRTANRGLAIPAFNERASKLASLVNNGAVQIEASEDNAQDYAGSLATLDYTGWWRVLHELMLVVDTITSNVSSGRTLVSGSQNVELTTFQTIGGIELLTAESALMLSSKFRVLAFTTSAADACEVRLFNLTTAAVVASSTLSFTNTTPAELNVDVTLPTGDNVYLVQMRLATTGIPNQAFCLNAQLVAN